MRRDGAYLLDMLLAAQDVLEFSAGLPWSEFERSRLHQSAVLKAIETIGAGQRRRQKRYVVSQGRARLGSDRPQGHQCGA